MNDLNDALVKGALEVARDIFKEFAQWALSKGKNELQKIAIEQTGGFQKYLERNYRSVSRIKTLLNPSTPVPLETTYESPKVTVDNLTLSEDKFVGEVERLQFIILTGLGGSGKSVLLKHIFIQFYKNSYGRIPIFVELRNIPTGTSLNEYIWSEIHSAAKGFNKELFEYALEAGKFLFLLDGFDEVTPDFRDSLAEQIINLAHTFGNNRIIMTSRPESNFAPWNQFYIAQIRGFDKKQVLSLIGKLRYDIKLKSKFKEAVKSSLYDTHETYLSNPLLCIIMLMTFEQGADIPNKMSVFFALAFDVLFYKHDSSKGVIFRRKFKTSLSIDDFKAVSAAFGFFSYLRHGSSFTREAARECAKQAIAYYDYKEKQDDFLHDMCSSVSIMIVEGEKYNYIHRTFQEYFVAIFLAQAEFDNWEEFIENILVNHPNDSTVRLCYEINKDKFERKFLYHKINKLRSIVDSIDVVENPAVLFSLFYLEMDVSENSIKSLTLASGSKRAEWNFLLQVLEGSEFNFFSANKKTFAWGKHAVLFGAEEAYEEEKIWKIANVSDEFLRDTPMHEYLIALKEAIRSLDAVLRASVESQQKLLSSLLKRRAALERPSDIE